MQFTQREADVLGLLHLTNLEIAQELVISKKTVENMIRHLLQITKQSTRTGMYKLWVEGDHVVAVSKGVSMPIKFSPQEIMILNKVVAKKPNEVIAHDLGIKLFEVQKVLRGIYQKTGTGHSRRALEEYWKANQTKYRSRE